MATTSMGSIFPRGPVWFIKLPHPSLDKPKRGSSGIRISGPVTWENKKMVVSRAARPSYEAALKVRDQWLADLDKPKAAAIESVTLSFAIGRYHTSKVLQSPSVSRAAAPEKTAIVRNFLSIADRLYRGFGANTPIENITTPMISAFRDKLLVSGRMVAVKGKAKGEKVESDQGIAPSSINAYLRMLSAVLRRERDEYETLKVLPKIIMLKENKDKNVWALEDGEVEQLLQAARDYPYLERVLQFSLNTGARKTEMMMLTWDKIDGLQAGANSRAVVKFIEHTKGDKKRQLTITDGLRDMLRTMRQEQLDGGYDGDRVFAFRHKYSGGEWIDPAGMQETVWRVREAAELPDFTLHICRHTFASRQLRAGKGLTLIQAMLGHSEYKTTQIYAKWAKEHVVDAADALEANWQPTGVADVPAPASL